MTDAYNLNSKPIQPQINEDDDKVVAASPEYPDVQSGIKEKANPCSCSKRRPRSFCSVCRLKIVFLAVVVVHCIGILYCMWLSLTVM